MTDRDSLTVEITAPDAGGSGIGSAVNFIVNGDTDVELWVLKHLIEDQSLVKVYLEVRFDSSGDSSPGLDAVTPPSVPPFQSLINPQEEQQLVVSLVIILFTPGGMFIEHTFLHQQESFEVTTYSRQSLPNC